MILNRENMKKISDDEVELHGQKELEDYLRNDLGATEEQVERMVRIILQYQDGNQFGFPNVCYLGEQKVILPHKITKVTFYRN